jgi:hypothetical protein
MGNCCFKLPIPTHGNALLDSFDDSNNDWLVLDHDNGEGLLTMILTLEETSDLTKTKEFIEKHASMLKNVLFSKPRRSSSRQPTWTSPAVMNLLEAVGKLSHLEVLLLHEVGTPSNPMPIHGLQKVVAQVHPQLKQTYLVGHFVGDTLDCVLFAASLKQQPQLQSFALYGNGSREFTLDPILQAVSELPTLKSLYFHGNMPNPLQSKTIQQVGAMTQLENLTIHSCDTSAQNLTALSKCLETSQSLKELTVFEAFEMFQGNKDNEEEEDATTLTCADALCSLLVQSPSLEKVQVWFGFCSNSNVLKPFAKALAQNPRITHFETALLWTEYNDDTALEFVHLLRKNVHMKRLKLCGYKGCWRLPLWFFLKLNQSGRGQYVKDMHSMTPQEWIDVLTNVPELTGDTSMALEDAPEDDDWFALSWRYTYLRMQPSLVPMDGSVSSY